MLFTEILYPEVRQKQILILPLYTRLSIKVYH